MLGQTLEGMKSKPVSQNSKIMFRTEQKLEPNQLATVIASVRYFKRRPITLEPNLLKKSVTQFVRSYIKLSICQILSNSVQKCGS